MASLYEEFQTMIHEKFFLCLLGNDFKDMESKEKLMFSLPWINSQVDQVSTINSKFMNILISSVNNVFMASVSGDSQLLLDFADSLLAAKEILMKINEGICYAQRWAKLSERLTSGFEIKTEGGDINPAEFIGLVDPIAPESNPQSKELVGDLNDGRTMLALLKDELFNETHVYELSSIQRRVEFEADQLPLGALCYESWVGETWIILTEKLRLFANKLRKRDLSGELPLFFYSMNLVLYWSALVLTLSFIPLRENKYNFFFSQRLPWGLPEGVPWNTAVEMLLSSMWINICRDEAKFSYGCLSNFSEIAYNVKHMNDVVERVENNTFSADHISQIEPYVIRMNHYTKNLRKDLNGLKLKLKVLVSNIESSQDLAYKLLEKCN